MFYLYWQLIGRGILNHHGNTYLQVYLQVYFQKYLTEEERAIWNAGGFIPWDLTQ